MEQSFPKVKPRILVIENYEFYRLALADILEICDYNVVAVESGRLAKEELMKEEVNYDLIVLDYEMDGLELLTFIKETNKLKNIPVVMLSEGKKPESLPNGFKAAHLRNNPSKKIDKNPLAKFQFVRLIGRGRSSSVHLAKNTSHGEFYALKTVELGLKSPQERKFIQDQVAVFKRLKGPTIIRYYKHFIESDKLYIVMEYGGGTLSEKISEYCVKGHPLQNETVIIETPHLIFCRF